MPGRKSLIALAGFVPGMVCSVAPAQQDQITGSWAGWVYFHDGGDMPLRLHVEESGDTLSGSLDAPSENWFGLELAEIHLNGDEVVFVRESTSGARHELEGQLERGSIEGVWNIDGEPAADFALTRAPIRIENLDAESLARFEGVYRTDDGTTLLIRSWFWGDLILENTATGEVVGLFPESADVLFAGPSLYTPSPLTLHARVEEPAGSAIETLGIERNDGRSISASRVRLRETPVAFPNGSVSLEGTLVLPEDNGPHPAIVIAGGSGWRTRGATIGTGRLFASMGVAALCFDKRGFGESGGDSTAAFADIAGDLVAGVAMLRTRDDIRAEEVGLFGISRGGWHAPLAASMSDDVSFVIVFVAPAISPERQETTRRLGLLREQGVDADGLSLARRYLRAQFDLAATGSGWDEYARLRAEIEQRGWLDELGGPAKSEESEWRWARMNMRYDPIPAIERLGCDVLVMLGGADPNVTVEENKHLWEEALESAPTDDWTVHVVPEADHGFMLVTQDSANRRIHDAPGKAPGVWPMVERWITERTGAPE